MTIYRTAFSAVMDGMKCHDLMNNDWAQYNFRQVLEAVRIAELMEKNDARYYSIGSHVGLIEHGSMADAQDWAHETHESQKPDAFKLKRTARGYSVTSVF